MEATVVAAVPANVQEHEACPELEADSLAVNNTLTARHLARVNCEGIL